MIDSMTPTVLKMPALTDSIIGRTFPASSAAEKSLICHQPV
jgi:hypothetical protein